MGCCAVSFVLRESILCAFNYEPKAEGQIGVEARIIQMYTVGVNFMPRCAATGKRRGEERRGEEEERKRRGEGGEGEKADTSGCFLSSSIMILSRVT